MSARNLVKSTQDMIIGHIRDNIAQALQAVRDERADGKVNAIAPKEYFTYETAKALTPPCIFVIVDDGDFRLNRGPNFISAALNVNVSAVVQERTEDLIQTLSYCYLDALHEVLDGAEITSTNADVKLKIKATRFAFSRNVSEKYQTLDVFRKEVALTLEVEHWEQP